MYSAFRHSARSNASLRALRPSLAALNVPRLNVFTRTLITKKYTADHEAVVFDDATGLGIVTITDYAQASLGDVVFVELPTLGTKVDKGDQIGAVESVKAASDIFAPVSGTIEEINKQLDGQPGLLNKSAEEAGWLCKIKLSEPSEMDDLMVEQAYKAHCAA